MIVQDVDLFSVANTSPDSLFEQNLTMKNVTPSVRREAGAGSRPEIRIREITPF